MADDTNDPWLIAVCAGRWQRHGILSAQRAGIRVLALDGDPNAEGLALADHGLVVDIRDESSVIAAVENSGVRPAGAIAFAAEAGMVSAAALRARFGLPGPSIEVTRRLTDKSDQRSTWDAAGLPNPTWRRCANLDAAAAAFDRIGRPAIVKPVDGAGSRGVRCIDSDNDWREPVKQAFAAARTPAIMVESALPGEEYTVETFTIDGQTHVLAITVKRKVAGTRGTVADQLVTVDPTDNRVADLARDALAALGVAEGPGHVEIMVDDNGGIGLIEAAGRGGGFMVFDGLVPWASGYDLATATALQAVGRPTETPVNAGNAVVLRFLPAVSGVVEQLDGIDEANAIKGVEAGPLVAVGQRVEQAQSDGDRLYYILARATTSAKALALANEAEAMIHVAVRSEKP